jgi:hypothetical protein
MDQRLQDRFVKGPPLDRVGPDQFPERAGSQPLQLADHDIPAFHQASMVGGVMPGFQEIEVTPHDGGPARN